MVLKVGDFEGQVGEQNKGSNKGQKQHKGDKNAQPSGFYHFPHHI